MQIREWRYFSGPNVHALRPVAEMLLDLGRLEGRETRELPGFDDALVGILPGLLGHTCGLGMPGGFRLRLEGGTFFGHVVEHVALELLAAAGYDVVYGKTRAQPPYWQVVFEAPAEDVGLLAARTAVRLVRALAEGDGASARGALAAFRRRVEAVRLGPSTEAIALAAKARGIPVRRVGDGSLLLLGHGIHHRRVEATLTNLTSALAVDVACDKQLTRELLAMACLPVPRGTSVGTLAEALAAAGALGFPVVVKPRFGRQGEGVVTGVGSRRDLVRAYRLARSFGTPLVIEEERPGQALRALVVGGEVVAVALRRPAEVVGDGHHTLAELVARENANPLRGDGHGRPLTRIPLDALALRALRRQGVRLGTVLPPGRRVRLRDSANLSTGAVAVDVTDEVGSPLKELARRAAVSLGLDVAGVDLLSPDLSGEDAVVVEVNACPGIRMHEHPWRGRRRPVGEAIVRLLFPEGDGRIPIVAVTGTNGKSTTVRLIAHILRSRGLVVGMTTTDGAFVGEERLVGGDAAGPRSALAVLYDRRVEAAVLECARGGLRRRGLPFDEADVGVFLNLSADHLGQDGVDTMEQLLHLKALVVEAVGPRGHVVLNADDRRVLSTAARAKGEVVLFARSRRNPHLAAALAAGRTVVFLARGAIHLARHGRAEVVAATADLAFALNGVAACMVEDALAAVAATAALGLSAGEIRPALLSFAGGPRQNPGRLNLHEVGDVKVLIDYGHNPAALAAVLDAARRLPHRRLVGVVGMPGDRRDEDARRFGELAAQGFDRVLIKEDRDRRGRAPGEMARLILEGVGRAGGEVAAEVELDEEKAFARALAEGRPGDLVVVLYESLAPLERLLDEAKARRSASGATLGEVFASPPP